MAHSQSSTDTSTRASDKVRAILNFDNGKELIDIGYNNVEHKKYKLC